MDNCGNLKDLKLHQDSCENAWWKFVKAHEEYVECLDVHRKKITDSHFGNCK